MSASKTIRAARFACAVLGAAAIASLAPPAAASDAREQDAKVPASYPSMQKMKPVEVMHMIDTDKNGFVTREEFMKFQEDLFQKLDRNGDRRLGEPEFTDQG